MYRGPPAPNVREQLETPRGGGCNATLTGRCRARCPGRCRLPGVLRSRPAQRTCQLSAVRHPKLLPPLPAGGGEEEASSLDVPETRRACARLCSRSRSHPATGGVLIAHVQWEEGGLSFP